jgi:uncharacterized protein YjiS (DUF1127 family)
MRALLSKLGSFLRALRARRELRDLSDRMLKDIGVQRSEIDSLFR